MVDLLIVIYVTYSRQIEVRKLTIGNEIYDHAHLFPLIVMVRLLFIFVHVHCFLYISEF
jgi:hypothetical protein